MQKAVLLNPNVIKSKIETYLTGSGEARFIHRLQILYYLAEHEDQSCLSAARLFNDSPRAILNWLKKVNQTGDIESLKDQPGKGRKTKLTTRQLFQIRKALQKTPASMGIISEKWDGKTLSEYMSKKIGVPMQERQCQRLIHKLGYPNKRGRPKGET
ncbi:MAG TPA: hypothetical protein VNE41_04410 [Chitinophagaceae bacterium]|nr:hypothetical protein [Chitinophagaceae bacterium]